MLIHPAKNSPHWEQLYMQISAHPARHMVGLTSFHIISPSSVQTLKTELSFPVRRSIWSVRFLIIRLSQDIRKQRRGEDSWRTFNLATLKYYSGDSWGRGVKCNDWLQALVSLKTWTEEKLNWKHPLIRHEDRLMEMIGYLNRAF